MKKLLTLVLASCFCLMTGNLMAQTTLTVSTTSINLGSVQVGSTATGTFTVSGSGLKGNVTIISNNDQLTVSPTSIAKATAQSGNQTVTLTLSPTTAGNGSATVTVSSKNATSKTVSVSWTATVPPTLTVSETYINFGNVNVDATATRTFTVSGVSLTGNVSLSSNNAQLTVSPSSITKANAESGNQTVTLTLTPTAAAIGSAKVTIASQDATSKNVTVSWNSTGGNLPAGVVELPNTLDKSNFSGASAGMTYYNSTYFELGGDAYAEWTVYLSHPGNYFVSEQGYYHWGHNYLLELRDGNTVKSSYTTATTYDSGELTISQGTKWNLSSVPAGQYTLRVKCNLSGGDPCLKSLTLDYEGEIIPVIPIPDPDPNGAHVTYTADNSTIFPNPERGFYYHFEKHLTTSDPYCIKNSTTELNSHISDKGSLVLLVYYLDEYKSTTIPQTILNAFDEDMATLRSKGVKCIIRYAYTDSDAGEIGHDAPLSIVQQHINQLKPKWQANADVIFCFQVGWVGSWGEWYYSEYFGNKTSHMNADRISVVDAMLDAVPEDRCILIRTPLFKTEYIGSTTPLGYMEAYTGTPKSRIGHHNDAYLYGGEDQGTYSDTAVQKPYLAQETLYVPAGGETNETNSTAAQTKASYNNTIAETSRLHYTFINQGYAPEMTSVWRSNGAYDALRKWLGYRFQLVDGTYTQQAAPGGVMSVYMNIKNTGYAPLYNERPVFIVLKNNSNTYMIQMSADPRRWRPNGETTTVSEILNLPANIAVGTYSLYLYMPDAYESLRSNSKYSVRFANGNNMWDDNTGMNNLNASITISNNVSTPTLSVSPTTVSFGDVMMATTDTRTISVSGVNLLGNVTVSSNNAALTVSPATITPAEAAAGATITLSVHPTATGSGSAAITVASDGASSQTVNVTWNGTAVSGAIELPATLNKENVTTYSNDMTWYGTGDSYFDFGPEDDENTSRWAEWNVYLSHPGEYTISEVSYCANGHRWLLELLSGNTVIASDTTSDDHWGAGDQNYAQDVKWNLSNVPAGVYTLRVRNVTEWGQPKLQSITLECDALLTSHTVTWNATQNGGSCATSTSEIAIDDPLGTLPTATKSGYACIGWFDSATGGHQVDEETVPTSNVTYYAQFLPIPQLSGTAVDLPNTLNKANMGAVSEDMTYYGTNNDFFDLGPTDATNLYRWAAWRVNLIQPGNYTVTEETDCTTGHQYILQLFNGNNLVAEYTTTKASATSGAQVFVEATPWNLSGLSAGTYTLMVRNVYAWAQPKLKRLTLDCPTCSTPTYTITWNATQNGGTCATATTTITQGDPVGTLPTATKTGYTFTGWFTAATGGTQINASSVPAGNVTYYAQFAINSHTLTVVANNATYGIVSGGGTYNYGTSHTITATPNAGYLFSAWQTGGSQVSTNTSYEVTMPDEDVTYTALFTVNTHVAYTVKHYQQNLENDQYTEVTADRQTLYGTTGATTAAAAKTYTGFTAKAFSQGSIAGNGSTVVEIYYDRKTYTITWKNGDNQVIETDNNVKYGATPSYDGSTPTKTATAQYTYTFNNTWSPSVVAVTENATYTAQFSQTLNKYTVTWKNYDGTILETDNNVPYGTTPAYNSATPTKPATAQYNYAFSGWDPAISTVIGNITYTAQFDQTVRQYTLTVNGASGGGTYDYGTSVTLTATPAANYHFTQWSDGNTDNPRTVIVTGNTTYIAQSEEDPKTTVYLVPGVWSSDNAKYAAYVFEDGKSAAWSGLMTQTADGKAYTTQAYAYANIIFVRLKNTATAGNWDDKWNQTADLTLNTATYNCYQITGWGSGNSIGFWRNYPFYYVEFQDYDGTVLKRDTIDRGNAATVPTTPTRTGYTFAGWNKTFNNITADLTVTATYTPNTNTAYKVEHYQQNILNDQYTLTDTDNKTGTTATQTQATARTYTGFITKSFSQSTIAADGSTVVKIYYDRNTYTITWMDGDNHVLETDVNVRYGATPTYDGATPTKTATVQYTYTFNNTWSPAVSIVTGNQTYVAQFDYTVISYTVSFNANGHGTAPQSQTVAYGGKATEPSALSETGYTFGGWYKESTCTIAWNFANDVVQGNVELFAKWTPNNNTAYKVEHYQQNILNDQYTLADTDNKTGTTGANTAATAKTYTGFTAKSFSQSTIAADGSTVVKIYYDRKTYTISWKNGDNQTIETDNNVKYGATPSYDGATPTKTATAQYTYTFNNTWSPAISAVTGNQTYVAQFSSTVNTYTIIWKNENGTVLETDENVEYGAMPSYDGATPTKAATAQYTYTHSGWTPTVVTVTGDAVYTATYSSAVNEYTITWKDGNGNTLKTDHVAYGETPAYTGATPTKTATAQYTYTFNNTWTPTIVPVVGDATYTAQFNATVNQYTITWKNDDGTTIDQTTVAYGTVPTHAVPTKAATAQYTYTFNGWDPEVVAVTGNATYTATFTSVVNTYTITWKNEDGTILETDENVEYGTMPSYDGATPTKAATAQYTYTHSGWTPTIAAVTGDATYTATYSSTVNNYTVTFNVQGHGTAPQNQTVAYGGKVSAPTSLSAEGYTFGGWFKEAACTNAWNFANDVVQGNVTLWAKWTIHQWTLTWNVNGGSELTGDYTHGLIDYGTAIVSPADPTKEGYTFGGWNPGVPATMPDNNLTLTATWNESGTTPYKVEHYQQNVTGNGYTLTDTDNLTGKTGSSITPTSKGYTGFAAPTYEPATIAANGSTVMKLYYDRLVYEIKFVVEGTTVKSDNLRYGATPTEPATPTKSSDAQYTYTFSNWNPTIGEVTGDATYTAVFTRTVNTYTVIWKDENGTVLETDENVEYGAMPAYNGATPTKAATAQYTYTFSGWDPEVVSVTGDATYTATYSNTVNEYTITWIDGDGNTLKTEQVAYGQTPIYTGDTPTKEATAQYTYTFNNTWSPAIVPVIGNATYTAQFSSTVNKYTITWLNEDGTELKTEQVAYGEMPVYSGATPTKAATAQYTYTFAGWNPEVESVTGAATYTAVFTRAVNKYTVIWKDEDGTVLETDENVEYGAMPAYNGATPTKAATAQYSYAFAGWNPAVESVKGDATYTATYSSTVRKYIITFLNEGGALLQSSEVAYGEMPEYAGSTPTKAEDQGYTYSFAGWTPGIASVTGEATYTATFTATAKIFSGVTIGTADPTQGTVTANPQSDEYHYGQEVTITATANDGYSFEAWVDENGDVISDDATTTITITGNMTITAQFSANDGIQYTVRHLQQNIYDNEYTEVVADRQIKTGVTGQPTAAAAKTYDGFIAKSVTQKTITADGKTIVDIYYDRQVYEIKFVVEGVTVSTQDLRYGAMPTEPDTPTKPATAQYTYTFDKWNPAIAEVTGNKTYTALFTETVNKYTVTWIDGDGNTLKTEQVAYGETPVYSGAEPTKAEDQGYTYSFAGWTPAIVSVTGEATYTATFTATAKIFNGVTIGTADPTQGTVTANPQSDEYHYGQEVTITATANDGYNFEAWVDENGDVISDDATTTITITGNMTITAQFSANDGIQYTVRHLQQNIYDNEYTEVVADRQIKTGVTGQPTAAAAKTYDGFIAKSVTQKTITADGKTIVDIYYDRQVYEIQFVVEGVTVSTQDLRYGAMPTEPATPTKIGDAQYSYSFSKWTPEVVVVTEDATYTAQFTQSVNKYTITWLNEDGTLLKEEQVAYGETPVYVGAEPTKAATDQFTYTFNGWNPAIVEVTENAVYTATYSSTVNKYTVTWLDEDGSLLREDEVEFGKLPEYGDVPTKAADAQYTYTFSGWNPEITVVKGNQTYTASYTSVVNEYVITWVDGDDQILKTDHVAYGEIPVYEGATPTKAEDENYTYTFIGWSPEIMEVTGDATYTAVFEATAKTPTGIETVEVIGNSISGPEGMRIYDYNGHDVTGIKDHLYMGTFIIVVDGQARKVMIP